MSYVITNGKRYPTLSLVMADEDTVNKFYEIVGVGYTVVRPRQKQHWQDMLAWRCGVQKDIKYVIKLLWPYLGELRTLKAIQLKISP